MGVDGTLVNGMGGGWLNRNRAGQCVLRVSTSGGWGSGGVSSRKKNPEERKKKENHKPTPELTKKPMDATAREGILNAK